MNDPRDFKGIWIPKEIWLNKDLSLNEKVFLVEIDSLDGEKGCYAGNDYFSDFFNLSKNRCSEIINQLSKKDYLKINLIYKPGTKAIEKRIIKINKLKYLGVRNIDKGIRETDRGVRELDQGYSENCEDNNTITNNTINNTISKDIVCRTDKSDSTEKTPYDFIIDLFNSTCKSLPKVKARNKTRDKHIKTMVKALGADKVKELFSLVESSDYLSGRNGKWLNCSFDWVIKESNYTKVFEGNYHRNQKVIDITNKRNEATKQIKIDKSKLGGI